MILCAAWKGRVNLEDTLYAGALSDLLLSTGWDSDDDAVLVSSRLYHKVAGDLAGALANSSHVQRLQRFGIQKDIDFAIRIDEYDLVAGLKEGRIEKLA